MLYICFWCILFYYYMYYFEILNSIDVWLFIEFVILEDIMQILINMMFFLYYVWIFFLVCGIGVVYDKNYIGGDIWVM